jgi:hypothetical protein
MELSPWLLRLEQHFGNWGVPHLIRGLVLFNCLALVLQYLQPGFTDILAFDTGAIRAGEYWRVVTFLLNPETGTGNSSLFLFVIAMWFLWFIGNGLEQALGPLLLNVYLLLGVATVSVVGLVFYPDFAFTNFFVMESFLFAFATFYPDLPILLFFVIQVKIKYIAYFGAVMTALHCLFSPLMAPIILASVAGYLVFFGPLYFNYFRQRASSRRRMKKFRGED